MPNIKRANTSGITKSGVAISDVPDAPTIGAVTDTTAGGTVTVAYTAAVTGGTATTFTATSSPGGVTGTGSSPINVTGLTDGTAYTFTVTASNSTGSATSGASASVTPTSFLTGAYDSIATTTVGAGGTSSVTFSSIPSTYTHLQLRYFARTSRADITDWVEINFNSDTGNNYASHYLRGNGSFASVSGLAAVNYGEGGTTVAQTGGANMFGTGVIDILDYTNTNKNTTIRSLSGEDRNGLGFVYFFSSLWMNTNAVNTILLTPGLGTNFSEYTSFALYGIKGA